MKNFFKLEVTSGFMMKVITLFVFGLSIATFIEAYSFFGIAGAEELFVATFLVGLWQMFAGILMLNINRAYQQTENGFNLVSGISKLGLDLAEVIIDSLTKENEELRAEVAKLKAEKPKKKTPVKRVTTKKTAKKTTKKPTKKAVNSVK